ncbi:MAG: hypothetical protein SVV80_02685 [Planctomycetota bacterium]|nr:hypothetical protein [Planctomycetota bacterium]
MKTHRLILLFIPVFLSGCTQCPEKFVSLETLVGEYNANASQVRRLWARARIRVTLSNDAGWSISLGSTSPLAAANALLLLDKGDSRSGQTDFVLRGREMIELFRVGIDSTEGLYYCWAIGGRGGAWFGRTKYAGAPGVAGIPLDPLQLVEILGITELPAVQTGAMPAVVMMLQNTPGDCAYVVRYLKPQPVSGHLKIWREVYFRWSDTRPRLPYQVKLYDADGFCRVVAEVSDYKPIATDTDSDGENEGPIMPTDIRITFPAIKNVQPASSLHMRLSEMSTTKQFSPKAFDFRSHLPTEITNPVQVDSAYEDK